MQAEPDKVRFFAEMSFFAAAMQGVVLAGDWILLLACWELIGLASYLLIGFWYERPLVPAAATRAFLTTRGADLGLYVAVFALVSTAGTSDVGQSVAANTGQFAIGMLLLLAAMGKSAQVPFHGWLQDAMLGPTPVSALLHSATLVAAGAILLIRSAPLFSAPMLTAVAANRLPLNSEAVAKSLFDSYLLPFEIASVLLLVAMIGAVVMAKKRA